MCTICSLIVKGGVGFFPITPFLSIICRSGNELVTTDSRYYLGLVSFNWVIFKSLGVYTWFGSVEWIKGCLDLTLIDTMKGFLSHSLFGISKVDKYKT